MRIRVRHANQITFAQATAPKYDAIPSQRFHTTTSAFAHQATIDSNLASPVPAIIGATAAKSCHAFLGLERALVRVVPSTAAARRGPAALPGRPAGDSALWGAAEADRVALHETRRRHTAARLQGW